MKTSEVLNRAADLIEERGWASGTGWNKHPDADTPLCMEGALQAAAGLSRDDHREFYIECPAYNAVVDYLGKNPQPRFAPIMDAVWMWNDCRTDAAEVIEVLRATALIEAAKEQPEPVHEDADERTEVGAK